MSNASPKHKGYSNKLYCRTSKCNNESKLFNGNGYTTSTQAIAAVSSTSHPNSKVDEMKGTKMKKVYPCLQCSKSFSRPSQLQTHTYTHTNEKPFGCTSPGCSRRFSVASNLRRHLKIHQKPVGANTLSSEERIKCVKRLMKRASLLLPKIPEQDCQKEVKYIPEESITRSNRRHIVPSSSLHKTREDSKVVPQSYSTHTMPDPINNSRLPEKVFYPFLHVTEAASSSDTRMSFSPTNGNSNVQNGAIEEQQVNTLEFLDIVEKILHN